MEESKLLRSLMEYKRLEDDFVELTQYIPLAADPDAPNYSFASPRAADFGLDCATWLETLMTELLNDPRVDSYPDIERLRARPNFHAYRKVFTEILGFGMGGWRLKDLGGEEIRPFESWKDDRNPEWFRTYSKEKHNRFALASKWTMKHSLMVFVALTMIIQHWKKPKSWTKRESRILEGVVY